MHRRREMHDSLFKDTVVAKPRTVAISAILRRSASTVADRFTGASSGTTCDGAFGSDGVSSLVSGSNLKVEKRKPVKRK